MRATRLRASKKFSQTFLWLARVFLPAAVARAAFLSRVVHGGGSVEREYAIGTRRMDLCVRYRRQILGMELKVSTTAESPSGRTITVVRA